MSVDELRLCLVCNHGYLESAGHPVHGPFKVFSGPWAEKLSLREKLRGAGNRYWPSHVFTHTCVVCGAPFNSLKSVALRCLIHRVVGFEKAFAREYEAMEKRSEKTDEIKPPVVEVFRAAKKCAQCGQVMYPHKQKYCSDRCSRKGMKH